MCFASKGGCTATVDVRVLTVTYLNLTKRSNGQQNTERAHPVVSRSRDSALALAACLRSITTNPVGDGKNEQQKKARIKQGVVLEHDVIS